MGFNSVFKGLILVLLGPFWTNILPLSFVASNKNVKLIQGSDSYYFVHGLIYFATVSIWGHYGKSNIISRLGFGPEASGMGKNVRRFQ